MPAAAVPRRPPGVYSGAAGQGLRSCSTRGKAVFWAARAAVADQPRGGGGSGRSPGASAAGELEARAAGATLVQQRGVRCHLPICGQTVGSPDGADLQARTLAAECALSDRVVYPRRSRCGCKYGRGARTYVLYVNKDS